MHKCEKAGPLVNIPVFNSFRLLGRTHQPAFHLRGPLIWPLVSHHLIARDVRPSLGGSQCLPRRVHERLPLPNQEPRCPQFLSSGIMVLASDSTTWQAWQACYVIPGLSDSFSATNCFQPSPPRSSHSMDRQSTPFSTPRRRKSGRPFVSDPSAGSPTETLLRLLLPLNDTVWTSFQSTDATRKPQRSQSEVLTKSFNR